MFSSSIKRTAISCGLVLSSLIFPWAPVASRLLYKSETDVASKTDWVLVLRSSKLKNFLKYKGSGLFPITEIRCSSLRSVGPAQIAGPTRYEDLWYHDGAPVGCRHYGGKLSLDRSESGIIYVEPGPESASDTRAMANAIIRLALDLSLQDIVLIAVVVPEDICQQIVTDLGSFGFHRKKLPTGEAGIHLVSNPLVFDDYLYFDKPSSP